MRRDNRSAAAVQFASPRGSRLTALAARYSPCAALLLRREGACVFMGLASLVGAGDECGYKCEQRIAQNELNTSRERAIAARYTHLLFTLLLTISYIIIGWSGCINAAKSLADNMV